MLAGIFKPAQCVGFFFWSDFVRYGIPYKGSKNTIAKKIIDFLPEAETLVDICAGGCAITHAALEHMEQNPLTKKWNRVIANDINPIPLRLFGNAVNGKYANEKRWISREDFFRLKEKDEYVKFCWSFGNNGIGYLYAKEIEPWKRALHYAYVLGDNRFLSEICGEVPKDNIRQWIRDNEKDIKEKYISWYKEQWKLAHNQAEGAPIELQESTEEVLIALKKELQEYLRKALQLSGKRACDVDKHLGTNGMAGHYFGKSQWEFPTPEAYIKLKEILPLDREYPWHLLFLQSLERLQSLQSLQRLESLERLQSLQSLESLESLERLQRLEMDYRDVQLPDGCVVYCDPPYAGTNGYGLHKSAFDQEAFWNWARKCERLLFISEYSAPVDFVPIVELPHRSRLSATTNNSVTERLFVHESRYNELKTRLI